MSQMRARSSRVSRDVKMVFDLYVETLEGGTPGQQYTAHYQRGVNEKKASEPITADREGNVNFMWHSTFTSTLQRKNDNCYKQKDLRLWVREHPSGFMVTETWYDLAASVDNEVFPNKKLKVKSATGKQSVLFSMSGITEEEYVRFTSDKSRGTSRARSVVSAAYNDPAQDEDPDTHDDDRQRNTSVVSASRAKSTQSRQQNIQEDDDDVDLDNLVDGAVAKASGPRPATDSALPTPKVQQQQHQQPQKQPQHQPQQQQQQQQQPQQRSESPAPRDAAPPPSIQPKTVSTTAPPAERPPPATVSQQRRDAPLPPPASQSQPHRSESPVAAIPSRHATAPPPPPSDYDERSSALPTPQQSVVVQPSEAHRVSPVYDDLTHQRSVSAASATFSQPLTRSEKEVEKYLSEITAAVLAMSSDGSRSDTSAPASVSTGVHTFSIVGGAKTSSSIPRATLLALHCIMHWTGAKRIAFLHDFIAMLMVDVVPHTRHAPQWMNTLLHILFYTMTQMDDNTEDAYDFLSEEEAVHLTDEFMQCILNAEESGFGSRNTFVVRGSRNDRLHQLFSYDDRGDNEANQRALSPAALILFNLGLDESLRRLAAAATSPAMADIERFCFPPPAPPTRHSINGYHYDSTNSYGVGGGGPDHAAEDAAFSVVLHALNRLYFNILGVSKDNINSATALLKLTGAEVFKIIFRNINNTLLNHVITKDRSGRPTCRIRTVDDAMNFKLALSMLESWLQEHHMYITARSELLACRQLCDLVILHKPLLKNMDLSDEVTSALSPQLVVFVLEQYEPSAHTDDADAVPKDILDSFRKAADDSNRLAAKKSKHASTDIVPRLPIRSLMTFPFLDFISSFFQADDPTGRKSMRMSVMASRTQQSFFGDQPVTASAQRALDWDYRPDRLTELRNRESFLGVSTTHDAAGRELSVKASRDAQTNLSLKVLALSVADDDTIRRTVV